MCFWLFHVSLPVIDNPICQNLEYWVSSRNSGTWLSFYFSPFRANGTSKSHAGGGGGGGGGVLDKGVPPTVSRCSRRLDKFLVKMIPLARPFSPSKVP